MRITIIGVFMALLLPAIAAGRPADQPGKVQTRGDGSALCGKAYHARTKVTAKFGARAPGRNICRFGIETRTGARLATVAERKSYLRALEQMLAPPPVVRGPGAPVGTSAPGSATASCIIRTESGGNPQASNGSHFGIAQWAPATWAAQGGPAMTGQSDPRGASYAQQVAVLNHALATTGSGDWSPYDGC